MLKNIKLFYQKNKIVAFTSLLLTTSIVCPLTSCSSDGTSNDIGGFDKEFGFDAQTYNSLERQFASKYSASLKEKDIDKDVYINKFNNFLKNDLTILRNKLFNPAQNYSFTVRTNTLLDYASKNYNIYLNRNANVSEIDFDNLKHSSLENFIIYMVNAGFTKAEIDERKAAFNNKFDEILEKCKSKTTDNAQILMQLRADVIDCWQDLDYEFSYLSAYNHLKAFFDEYEFVIKDQEDNDNLWDNLLKNPSFMGSKENCNKIDQDIDNPIEDDWIKKLFTISRRKNKNEIALAKNNLNNQVYEKIDHYDSEAIIPGYILTPVLKKMTENIYANTYEISIDWQLMSNKYKDASNQDQKSVTAHLGSKRDGTNNNNDQFSSHQYKFMQYQLLATPQHQKDNLKKAYFTNLDKDQSIIFSWDPNQTHLEHFLPSDVYEIKECPSIADQYEMSMSLDNLSNAGLKINNKSLSELLFFSGDKLTHNSNDNTINDNKQNDLNSPPSIGEKFVQYCNFVGKSNVSFNDVNNSKPRNKITTSFAICYKNNNNVVSDNIATPAEITNIKVSNDFSKNAIACYYNVNKYTTDSKKIKIDAENALFHSLWIKVFFGLTCAYLLIIVIVISIKYCKNKCKSNNNVNNPNINSIRINNSLYHINNTKTNFLPKNITQSIANHPWISFIILLACGLILTTTWLTQVDNPINEHVDNANMWNDVLNGKKQDNDINNLNILKKLKEDKDNFASIAMFQKYFDNYKSKAFRSYWYYCHFNHAAKIEKDEDRKQNEVKEVVDDYNEFIKTRSKYLLDENTICELILIVLWFIPSTIFFIVICILVCDACKSNNNNDDDDSSNDDDGNDNGNDDGNDDGIEAGDIVEDEEYVVDGNPPHNNDNDDQIIIHNDDNNEINSNNKMLVDEDDKDNINKLNEIINENDDNKIVIDQEKIKEMEEYNAKLDKAEKDFQQFTQKKQDESQRRLLRLKLDNIKAENGIQHYRTLESIVNDKKLSVAVRKSILTLTKDLLAIEKQLNIANQFDIYLGNLKFEDLGNIDIVE